MGPDTYAASDEFLALIFADPGLFEDAYTLHGVLLGTCSYQPHPIFPLGNPVPFPQKPQPGRSNVPHGCGRAGDGHDEPG